MSVTQRPMTAEEYDVAAWEYYRTLPMEHFMEATPQATQREIALASFALLRTRRRDVQYFSELLVQYWYRGKLRRVVPDNMLVVGNVPEHPRSSYATELEPASPLMMLEWVSDSSEGKDYGESFRKYEQELQTAYCLCFHPDKRKWEVYRHDGQRYVQLEPDLNGRVEVPELELRIGLREGWIRFWHQGELLEIPSELQQRLDRQTEKISRQTEKISRQTEKISRQTEKISRQSEHIGRQSEQIKVMTDLLREQVADRAGKAGRQDVLDELMSADFQTLKRWLSEM